ncbi:MULTISPECIES: hypothetical protein [Caloramator]|uniref:Uncharacterized protein n=1 Tax=Caloramator australicus RC3 TaxID=857293 RepID=G0V4P9_9CLOT|nr:MULTISPECIES: hypothetical protein [Caloramator]MDO6353587.1 hypothetical protein [Caloramator sp. CAR-1]CCC58089.1 hypothetical protein CAAU_0440 [Caloramator australicus RC3]
MIDREKIIEFLENEGLSEIDVIDYKDEDVLVLNFFYTFDEAELEAAKQFANDNYEEDNEDVWYEEYFLPYLTDMAADNIRDIVDDLGEKFGVEGEFVLYEMDRDYHSECECILALAEKGKDFDIEDILDELE